MPTVSAWDCTACTWGNLDEEALVCVMCSVARPRQERATKPPAVGPGLGRGRHSTMIHNNQPNDGVGSGGGAWERRRDRKERVREDVYPSFRGVECSDKILKIERATEP